MRVTERTSEATTLRVIPRIREIYAHREILMNLIRKELKVKYAASILGAVWSILNPIVFLAVFSFVVAMLTNPIPHFPVYLLSGLLAWNLFSVALGQGARCVVDNGNLVKKVSFPREILPLSIVGVTLVDFVLQSSVLLLFMLVTGYGLHLAALVLYPLAFLALVIFTVAMVLWISALNVRYRDIGHLIGLALLVWFWFTPIVYPGAVAQQNLSSFHGFNLWNWFLLNPLSGIIFGFQRALYGPSPAGATVTPFVSVAWTVGVLGAVVAGSTLLLYLSWRLFFRLSGDFAEEL
jgi:ABC-type polysaccharide/polyol phosphate export systems, permease component